MLWDSQPIDSLKPGLRGNINSFLRKKTTVVIPSRVLNPLLPGAVTL